MVILGVGAFGALALLGVDASELLRDRWWSGELGSSRLHSLLEALGPESSH